MAKHTTTGRLARTTIGILARAAYPWHGHGGLERHVYDLVRHLMSRDVCVTLVTPPGDVRGPAPGTRFDARAAFDDPRFVRRTVRYVTFPLAGRRGTTVLDRITAYPLFGRRAGRLVAAMVARGEIDIVYGLGASALGYAQARRLGAAAPFIFNPQGLEEFGATDPAHGGARLKHAAYAPLRMAVRACARAADRVIATDRVLEPVVRRHLQVEPSRIAVIPNAVDVEMCDRLAGAEAGRRIRASHNIADDEMVVLSVGRLEANKGFHLLARALSRVAASADSPLRWRWVLVGDGPYRSAVEHAVDDGGLRPRVLMAGRVGDADLHAWYEAATLFVHPTLYEGSSLVALEAMAHRKAVVATTAGGLPDKVRPGESGWLVQPGDVPALARALEEAFSASERLRVMGNEGRAIVETGFSWSHVADVFLALCTELLDRQQSARQPTAANTARR